MMKLYVLLITLLLVASAAAQSGRTVKAAATDDRPVKELFDEANSYRRIKYEEFEKKKIGVSKFLREQTEKKVYHLFGPLTDGGKTRGIIILTAGSADEARAIVGADAAVQGGVLGVEVHPLVLPNLDGLKIDYPPRQ